MIGEVIDAATTLFEEKIMSGENKINSRAMGAGEKAGQTKLRTLDSVLVAPTGWRKTQDAKHGGYQYEVSFSAFCGSKNKTSDYVRTLIAAMLAAQVTKLLEDQNWGLRADGVGKANFERATDRTTLQSALQGIAIYEVSWWQEMPMVDVAALELYLLSIVRVETDLYGSLDNTDEMISQTGNLQTSS